MLWEDFLESQRFLAQIFCHIDDSDDTLDGEFFGGYGKFLSFPFLGEYEESSGARDVFYPHPQ